MCNLNVFKFFALTRTCMHLKVGLNRKRLGKTENLILTCRLLFLLDGIYTRPPPPPPAHTPRPKPLPEPNLPSEPGRSLTPFFTFKEDHVSLFLVKMFLKPVHTRLRGHQFFSSFSLSFFYCIWPYTYKGPSQEFWGSRKNSHLFSDGYHI